MHILKRFRFISFSLSFLGVLADRLKFLRERVKWVSRGRSHSIDGDLSNETFLDLLFPVLYRSTIDIKCVSRTLFELFQSLRTFPFTRLCVPHDKYHSRNYHSVKQWKGWMFHNPDPSQIHSWTPLLQRVPLFPNMTSNLSFYPTNARSTSKQQLVTAHTTLYIDNEVKSPQNNTTSSVLKNSLSMNFSC